MKKLIPAVSYLRRSTDKQQESIPAQREAVERYAEEHGYEIIHEYKDDGISGDDTGKRKQFQRMIADAARGSFKAIICWDQDRFGRFNSLEAGYWIHPLIVAGVSLVTLDVGPIDWNDFTQRLMYGIKQEGKHQFLRDLSRNVTRGMTRLAEQGKWAGGAAPVGYALENKMLVLGTETDVSFVRRMYAEYLAGKSLRGMADTFNLEGRLSPKGKLWTANGISGVLKNPVYTGDFTWNQRCPSKYKRAGRVSKFNDPSQWIVMKDHHPPIIDRETFAKVQEQLSARKTCSTPHPSGGGFVLSGVLHCGCCGYRMTGDLSNGVHSYTCYGYMQRGKNFCDRHTLRQEGILTEIADALREKYFNSVTLKRLADAMRRQFSKLNVKADSERLRIELSAVEGKLTKAKKRLVEVDADMQDVVQEQIRELRANADRLTGQLKNAAGPRELREEAIDAKVAAALEWFARFDDAVQRQDKAVTRQLIRDMVVKVEVWTEKIPWTAKRFKRRLLRGRIELKSENLLSTAR